jgi:hypothetical protein
VSDLSFAAANQENSSDTGFLPMPYTLADFRRDYLKKLTVEERLEGLSPEERLDGLSPEQRLKGLSPDQIEKYLRRTKQPRSSPKRKKKR